MANQINSPFQDPISPKSTTPQAPTGGGIMGHDKIIHSPEETGNFKTVFYPDIPATTGSYDSPFDSSIAKSIKDVSGPAPSGNSAEETPFKDALAKGKL